MIRTPTKLPTDRGMWRKLKARVHPDVGGSHEEFIWVSHLEEHVCASVAEDVPPSPGSPSPRPKPRPTADPDRVPFLPDADFRSLTHRAMMLADDVPLPYRSVLRLLGDCEPLIGFEEKQERGASYKQLPAIGHAMGMTKVQRVRWYRIAESVPLSDRHAGHLLGRLKRKEA